MSRKRTVTCLVEGALLFVSMKGAGDVVAKESPEPMLVVLRASAPTSGPFVRLAEIADLPNDPRGLRNYAGEIFLGFSPDPGGIREIKAEKVAARLREAGIEEGQFQVKGPEKCAVFFPEDLGKDREKSTSPTEAMRSGTSSTVDLHGMRGPAGRFARRDRPSKGTPFPASYRTKALEPGKKTGPAGSDAGGLRSGVEKGDKVIIRIMGRASIIEEPGRAQESARTGELLQVLNLRTGKMILARLAGNGLVEFESELNGR